MVQDNVDVAPALQEFTESWGKLVFNEHINNGKCEKSL